jgi:hypothetical protein
VSGDPARAAIDAHLLAWTRESDWTRDDARFADAALELFAFQFAHCAAYRRFCEGRGVSPERLADWRDIPTVPTGAFKELALTSFPSERAVHVFRTSGTSTSARGELRLDTLAPYEASLLPSFRRFLLPDLAPGERAQLVVLAPSRADAPDSSLSHMFDRALRELGDRESFFAVQADVLDAKRVTEHLAGCGPDGPPLLLCGTAFAFVHLLDALDSDGTRLSLPARTRIMETGGFKGRVREAPRDVLYARIGECLGVPPARIVNQYGMTELASQFYDGLLASPGTPRAKQGPPWARVRILDPRSGEPSPVGVIHVYDLANTGSLLAIQTADLGRALEGGFEVLGREPGAEQRGCSIAIDELLGRAP